jgi:hypothetical protein
MKHITPRHVRLARCDDLLLQEVFFSVQSLLTGRDGTAGSPVEAACFQWHRGPGLTVSNDAFCVSDVDVSVSTIGVELTYRDSHRGARMCWNALEYIYGSMQLCLELTACMHMHVPVLRPQRAWGVGERQNGGGRGRLSISVSRAQSLHDVQPYSCGERCNAWGTSSCRMHRNISTDI